MNSKHTIYASFIGYISQAIGNNLAPLLFSIFMVDFHLSMGQLTFLVSLNFCTQLIVDLLATKYADVLGYRFCVVFAHLSLAMGLAGLSWFLQIVSQPFWGLVFAVVLYAIGGGLIEVLISPIVEACPTKNKASIMSLLHSFYCWGCVLVISLSSLFFFVFGKGKWFILPLLWALVPLGNAIYFCKVPLYKITEEGQGMTLKELCLSSRFYLLLLMMVMAGASEQAMSQWASSFVELSLGLSKSLGDLLGPCFFAVLMGCSRVFYAKKGEQISLNQAILWSCVLGVISYIGIFVFRQPFINLLCCGCCGLSVGILWPGIFSISAKTFPKAGTSMFALLALCGDVGCALGPGIVGSMQFFVDNMHQQIGMAFIFPLMLVGLLQKNKKGQLRDG